LPNLAAKKVPTSGYHELTKRSTKLSPMVETAAYLGIKIFQEIIQNASQHNQKYIQAMKSFTNQSTSLGESLQKYKAHCNQNN
jgi:hypothetical protein